MVITVGGDGRGRKRRRGVAIEREKLTAKHPDGHSRGECRRAQGKKKMER
jgi:hypothetical protein